MKLFYRETGKGYPLVILHGLYGSSDNWISIARQLSDDFRIILPDQRNHGQSPHDKVHNYDELSNDIYQLVNDLRISRFILCGHSMGGKVAAFFASKWPEMLDGLIIIDISPFSYNNEPSESNRMHQTILKKMMSINPENLHSRDEAEQLMKEVVASERIRSFLLKNLNRKKNGVFEWRLNPENLYNNLDNIMDGFGDKHEDHESISGFPVTFIKAGDSDYIGAEDEEGISRLFPSSEMIEIPGTSHWVHAERPDEIIRIIREYFQD